MSKPIFDSIKPWFDAAEELGEYIGIRFGYVAPEGNEPEWVFLSHAEFDGIGGFADLLRRKGAKLGRLPQIKHPASPSLLPLIKLAPRFALPRQRVGWIALGGEKKSSLSDMSQPPSAVAWRVFDETATTRIRQVCRRAGVTVNSFLLKHLTKAIRPFLEDQSSMIPWMIPVNLRGKVVRERDTANHSSFIGVKVQSYETVHDIHQKIYATLGRREHWANWHAYGLGKFTTHGLRKFLIRRELAIAEWHLGSFSNLGDWDMDKEITQPACVGDWLFCPPVLRCQLIGAGCVTFQNRLSLMIQAHPELVTDSTIPKAWMQNWVKEIEMDLAGGLANPATFSWRGAAA